MFRKNIVGSFPNWTQILFVNSLPELVLSSLSTATFSVTPVGWSIDIIDKYHGRIAELIDCILTVAWLSVAARTDFLSQLVGFHRCVMLIRRVCVMVLSNLVLSEILLIDRRLRG